MKKNLNSKSTLSTLSFGSLEARARRAAANAAVEKAEQKAAKQQKKKAPKPEIELEVRSIFLALQHNVAAGEEVVLDRSTKDSACHSRICIYLKADLLRQLQEAEAYQKARAEGQIGIKPFKAQPKAVYALYAGVINREKLGSVAIYCDNPFVTIDRITKNGQLFGRKVKRATVEMGRRAFVDVTF